MIRHSKDEVEDLIDWDKVKDAYEQCSKIFYDDDLNLLEADMVCEMLKMDCHLGISISTSKYYIEKKKGARWIKGH